MKAPQLWPKPELGKQSIGDIVDVALKVAEDRHQLQLKIREALIAGNDDELKHFARQLVGLE